MTKKVTSVAVPGPEPRELDSKPSAELHPEFPFYYEDYAEAYNYDDQAYVDDRIPNVLPIINQRTDEVSVTKIFQHPLIV